MDKKQKAEDSEVIEPSDSQTETPDSTTDAVVDDIVRHDSDELLKSEDAEIGKAFEPKPENFKQKLSRWFSTWWQNKKLRYATLAGVSLLIILMGAIPTTRYGILNTVGAQAGMSMTVLDGTTQLPLKDAKVTVASQTAQTNSSGVVTFSKLKLGPQTVTISKIAFANVTRKITLGWGSNALGTIPLKAVGTQYRFKVVDYVTGKPIEKAEATSGEASAFSDKNGKIVLTVSPTQKHSVSVTISFKAYRDTQIDVPLGTSMVTDVQLVPNGKDVYVSNAGGNYDVYKIDLDGKNKDLLLAGTGKENSNITLVPSPDQKKVALAATRDNVHDSGGYLLYTLGIIDVGNGTLLTIDHGERIQVIGWVGTRLVYVQTVASASAANSQRTRIVSYDYASNSRLQLATADQFNAVLGAKGSVYYAVSSLDPSTPAALYKVDANGTNRQQVFNQEVWTVLRRNYDTLALQTTDNWFSYTFGGKPTGSSVPANYQSFSFLDSPDGTHSLWTDYRDGKGVLLLHDVATGKDTILASQSGLSTPFAWLNNDTIIYRISSPQETADYVISAQGGSAHKIVDVTNTLGAD